MKLDELIQNISQLIADPVSIGYRASLAERPRLVWVNEAFCETFDISREDALRISTLDLFHQDYVEDFEAGVAAMTDAGQSNFSQDTLCLRRSGSSFWASVSFTAINDAQGPGRHGIMVIRSIDDLKNREQSAELALIEREHLLAKVEATQARLVGSLEMIPDPFAIFDRKDCLITWNPAFAETVAGQCALLTKGMKNEEVLRIALAKGFIDDAIGQEDTWLEQHLETWRSERLRDPTLRLRGRDYKSILSRAANGDRVVLWIDISEQLRQRQELEKYARRLERANNEISHQALHDDLTGLGNRRFLTMKLDEMIAEREADGGEIVALHIDLDRFKQINDTMGHAAGDHVLAHVAQVLTRHLRQEDVVARIGGDEFVVLLWSCDDSMEPEALSVRLIREISRPIPYDDKVCRLGASIGIARTPVIDPGDLLTSSDVALYKAKQGGRSMHAVFDHIDLENLRVAKNTSDDILRALEEEEFVPHYQVQIDPISKTVVAVEVFARWQHPEKGLLTPDAFLPFVEDMQMICQLDRVMFRRAVEACRPLFGAFRTPPALAFNVSMERIVDVQLERDLDSLDFPFPLIFELAETEFLDRDHAIINRLNDLRQRGIGIELDDFGSGRASLVGLRALAPDRLKLDQRLIPPINESIPARKLVQSMIDIGRALEIPVMAEGVETAEHAAVLTRLGCDRLQGFLYGAPMPLSDTIKLIENYEQGAARTGTD